MRVATMWVAQQAGAAMTPESPRRQRGACPSGAAVLRVPGRVTWASCVRDPLFSPKTGQTLGVPQNRKDTETSITRTHTHAHACTRTARWVSRFGPGKGLASVTRQIWGDGGAPCRPCHFRAGAQFWLHCSPLTLVFLGPRPPRDEVEMV